MKSIKQSLRLKKYNGWKTGYQFHFLKSKNLVSSSFRIYKTVLYKVSIVFVQVKASMEKQAFDEAWGKKAKTVFPQAFLQTLTDLQVQKLIRKISLLGAANLPEKERQQAMIGYIHMSV